MSRQVGGSHYQTAIEPIDFIHANDLGFIEGNIVKYIVRHREKNGAQDIEKIIHYCELLLEREYGEHKPKQTIKQFFRGGQINE